jgi:hypothetical protein
MADFKVNGKEIDLPDMGTFSIDEAIVLYEYSGMTLDQAEEIEGLHPGIIGGLVHIAIARAEPERKAKEIEKAVRAMNLLDLLTSIPDEEEGEKEDLAPGSETSSSSSDKSSGPEFREEFGSVPGAQPAVGYWDARIGFFSVAPDGVGRLTPDQLMGCVDAFNGIHGVSED